MSTFLGKRMMSADGDSLRGHGDSVLIGHGAARRMRMRSEVVKSCVVAQRLRCSMKARDFLTSLGRIVRVGGLRTLMD